MFREVETEATRTYEAWLVSRWVFPEPLESAAQAVWREHEKMLRDERVDVSRADDAWAVFEALFDLSAYKGRGRTNDPVARLAEREAAGDIREAVCAEYVGGYEATIRRLLGVI